MPKSTSRPQKARKKQQVVEEVVYDADAREDYLTGFHKRKQQRIKHAQEVAARKEREARIEERKIIREQRAKDLEHHVNTVNSMLKAAKRARNAEDDVPDSDEGEEDAVKEISEDAKDDSELENEYIDEEKYTTVTVGPMNLESEEEGDGGEGAEKQQAKKTNARAKPAREKPKKKKKKFRYEAPAERKAARAKLKLKNNAAAKARREGQR